MRSPYLNPAFAGILTGLALTYIDIMFPNFHVCIVTFFLVGIVISFLPPYTMYEPSKFPFSMRKSGPADYAASKEGHGALAFMLISLISYVFFTVLYWYMVYH